MDLASMAYGFSGEMLTPVSVGEVVDKITILQIKAARIKDVVKLANVKNELSSLDRIFEENFPALPSSIKEKIQELRKVNEKLWDIEDSIRICESKSEFGPSFISLARAVYITNDERAKIKREINISLGSHYIEEKSYHEISS